jgi:hypothetical protein
MERFLKFLRLPADQRWLLIKATAFLALIRLALSLLPFPAVRPLLERASRRSRRLAADPPPAEQFAWATRAAGRIVPHGSHCLSQALALRTFLARRGYPARICFGVQQTNGAPFMAHAWVEHDGAVLIGGDNLHRFKRLVAPSEAQQ